MRAPQPSHRSVSSHGALRIQAGKLRNLLLPYQPPLTNYRNSQLHEDNAAQLANVSVCVAFAASLALRCPQALALNETAVKHIGNSSGDTIEATSDALSETRRHPWIQGGQLYCIQLSDVSPAHTCQALRQAPQLAFADLADAATGSAEASYLPESIAAGTYVPGPVEVGWQIYVGSAVAAFPFVLGAYEFGKRILIQRRCEKCQGTGLIKNGRFYRKCSECGGFFPWQGWKLFFTSTASPGNGGPLLQPRGQTSVLYKVPPKKKTTSEEELVQSSPSNSSSSESRAKDEPPQ